MKLRIAAFLFGLVFLAAGFAWQLPFLSGNDLLFGIFQMDSMHNKIYLGSGLLALTAASSSGLAKLYFKLFGGLYALIGILGFIFQDQFLAMQVNNADNLLHLLIGVTAVILGYKLKLPKGKYALRVQIEKNKLAADNIDRSGGG